MWLSVDAILLGIHHQTALQLPELTGLTHTLTYTDFLLVEHECLQARNYQEKKLQIPSQEVHDDDILPFLEMERKLKMSCEPKLHMNSLKMKYIVGPKSFRPDIQKLRQMENAVSAIYGEVNVSVEKCVEIKGDYVEK